ncbi:unnamed protein product [Cercopithifilaria johnstoni]|uniref:Uncharacterized protein n=1 Tax=Cercopithifilaria johnstoni TaxID=2874296 RepID=A0A8J2M2X7_9BILA|nr:unnamed protein product [Cercopithifilaria johnstoni]
MPETVKYISKKAKLRSSILLTSEALISGQALLRLGPCHRSCSCGCGCNCGVDISVSHRIVCVLFVVRCHYHSLLRSQCCTIFTASISGSVPRVSSLSQLFPNFALNDCRISSQIFGLSVRGSSSGCIYGRGDESG